QTARSLGGYNPERVGVYGDHVDGVDLNDWYKFTLTTPGAFSFKLYNMTANANMQLRDINNKIIQSSTRSGTNYDLITRTLGPGTYYVRVYDVNGSTDYGLRVASTAPIVGAPGGVGEVDNAGNSRVAARHIGEFAAGRMSSYFDLVGPSDIQDYYRFDVTDTVNFSAKLSNLTGNVNMQLQSADGGLIQIGGRS